MRTTSFSLCDPHPRTVPDRRPNRRLPNVRTCLRIRDGRPSRGDGGVRRDRRSTPLTWPRGPKTGLPMRHVITLRLPEEYRRAGADFPGIALFIGEGPNAGPFTPNGADDPFVRDVQRSREHPMLRRRADELGQQFAFLWLTEDELSGGRTSAPADSRRPGEHPVTDGGFTAWERNSYPRPEAWIPADVYVTDRPDPNAGKVPVEFPGPDDEYVSPLRLGVYDAEWSEGDHLGGSVLVGNGEPAGMTPWFLGLGSMCRFYDYGNGEAMYLDLESEALTID